MRAVSVMNCSWTQTNRSSRAKPRFTRSCSGATDTGLVFWISIAVTGGPWRRASGSPVRTRPICDWSSIRVPGRAASSPSISRLSRPNTPLFEWKAPPPRCCQAPVTAGMQSAACMLAAPLRLRAKP